MRWPAPRPCDRSPTCIPPTTSARTRRRAWRTSASNASTCSSSTSGTTRWVERRRAGSGPSESLKADGLVRAFGISVNRWEPANVLRALDTGLIDSVQVVYNIFDQAPEDELFPYCQARGIAHHRARAVRRRQPHRHADARIPRGPRATGATPISAPRTLPPRFARVERLGPLVPAGMDLPELALAVHPGAPGRHHRDSRHAARRATSSGTSRPATANACRPGSARPSGPIAGTEPPPASAEPELGSLKRPEPGARSLKP